MRYDICLMQRLFTFLKIPFVRDFATLQVGQVIALACGFISLPLYTRLLGPDGYGLYGLALAFSGIAGFFTNLGQQYTTLTFFAEAHARRDRQQLREVLWYYIALSGIAIAMMLVLMPVLPALAGWLGNAPQVGSLARLVFLSAIFDPVFTFVATALQVVRRIRLLTILDNVKTIAQLLISIGLLLLGWGVAGLLWGSVITSGVFAVISAVIYAHIRVTEGLPGLREAIEYREARHVWSYVKNGIWITLDKNIAGLFPNVFFLALGARTSLSTVGLVQLGYKLSAVALLPISNVSRLASSVIPSLVRQGGDVLRGNVRRLLSHTAMLQATVSVAALAAYPFIIPWFSGRNFQGSFFPFLVFVLCNMLLLSDVVATPLLRLTSKIYIATILNAVGMLGGIGLFFLLSNTLAPVRAFYTGIIFYHVIMSLVIIPTMDLLRHPVAANAHTITQ